MREPKVYGFYSEAAIIGDIMAHWKIAERVDLPKCNCCDGC